MDNILQTGKALVVTYGFDVIAALVIFFVGRWAIRFAVSLLRQSMGRANVDATLISFTANIAYVAGIAFVVIAALSRLGIQTASFIAVLGAAGLAVGLALQSSLGNFAAGVMMVLFRPFKVGDYVEGGGTAGTVEEILIFSTRLKTPDNRIIYAPNGSIMNGTIVNYSAMATRRVDLVFGCAYEDDIRKARDLLMMIVQADERVLADPAPLVMPLELADSSVNFAVRPWVKAADYWAVRGDLIEAVKVRFDQEGVSIPFPQRDVHLMEKAA